MIRKKVWIVILTIIKKIFPNGTKIAMKHDMGHGVYFWFDRKTDNGFILGFYEEDLASLIREKLKPGDVFYDLGAHWGYFSLLAARLVGKDGYVYSFEPSPGNYKRLTKNVAFNQPINITAFDVAVSSKEGTVNFTNDIDSFANSYVPDRNTKPTITVKTISLDNFATQNRPPDFIKIDVEGAELDVLQGSMQLLQKHKPLLHLSTHDIHNDGVDERCKEFLDRIGYRYDVISKNKHGKIIDYFCFPVTT